jgi:hypothetical protein
VGRRREAIIDGTIPEEAHAYLGRTMDDAPEIDGTVYVTGEGLAPGQIVPIEIVESRGYDLMTGYLRGYKSMDCVIHKKWAGYPVGGIIQPVFNPDSITRIMPFLF